MNTDLKISIQQEVLDVKNKRPHVVLLGAGASRAVCPDGDKNGKLLPLMTDFAKIVGLKSIFEQWGIDSSKNFEEIYSDLYDNKEDEKINKIQNIVEKYFEQLELPEKPTIYDHLILSLREKDLIATFNWDPLLIQACLRNKNLGLSLPRLLFLHGNIKIGYCEGHKVIGILGGKCKKCGNFYTRSPILYPIKKKEYIKNSFIANEWQQLKLGFQQAFMITIFGYSCPKTDTEAMSAMKEAWGNKNKRNMEQTSFITIQSEDEVSQNWNDFIHTHHYEVDFDFYSSWIANHPRRTGEAYLNQYHEAQFIENNPIPKTFDFPKLWKWYEQFKNPEENE